MFLERHIVPRWWGWRTGQHCSGLCVCLWGCTLPPLGGVVCLCVLGSGCRDGSLCHWLIKIMQHTILSPLLPFYLSYQTPSPPPSLSLSSQAPSPPRCLSLSSHSFSTNTQLWTGIINHARVRQRTPKTNYMVPIASIHRGLKHCEFACSGMYRTDGVWYME